MQDQMHLTFKAEEGAVRGVLQDMLRGFSGQLSAEEAGSLELTLAEVLNNIVEHAYAGGKAGPVRLALRREAAALFCRVEDEGLPMPGLCLPDGKLPPIAEQFEDLAEGGWGWGLIRAMTVDLAYERAGQCNRLTFRLPVGAKGT